MKTIKTGQWEVYNPGFLSHSPAPNFQEFIKVSFRFRFSGHTLFALLHSQSLPVPPGLSYSYCQQTEHPLKPAGFSNTANLFIQADTNMSTFSLLEAVYRNFSSLGTSWMTDIFIPVGKDAIKICTFVLILNCAPTIVFLHGEMAVVWTTRSSADSLDFLPFPLKEWVFMGLQ